ncbi:MAG TPA: transglycosylase domain-containing protein [Ktedonobacteraceae bacterium]|nr:transglycosylase domain-containing protein [Ktedonobacteraceae bacterium]
MNNWNQQPGNNHYAENNGIPHSGNLLRDYRPQQGQQVQQFSPTSQGQQMSPRTGLLSSQWAQEPASPTMPQSGGGAQGWVSNTVQMVRGWSGKMAAIAGYRNQSPPPPEPLVLYHPSSAEMVEAKPKPWKRSRTLRLAMQRRHRREARGNHLRAAIIISLLLLLVILASSGSAYGYGYYQSQLPKVQDIANQRISQTTHIYDRNGVLLKDVYDNAGGGRRVPISYKDIPQVMQDAMIAAEDPTFWNNSGIDPQGILRAAICGGCSGGSTITQQLIKNMTGQNADSIINRKIPEATMAIGLTQQYPKWKILEMYFNVSPFGSQDMGVEAAAEEYFHLMPQCDKNFKCTPGIAQLDYNQQTHKNDPLLGLARATLLAAMPQNPLLYDPTLGPDQKQNALGRQVYVLSQMMANGISVDGLGPVTPDIAQKVSDLTAKMTFQRYTPSTKDPHFVQWVTDQLEQILGPDVLLNGGFNVRTTIDANMQDYVERAVKRHITQSDLQVFPYVHYATLNKDNNVNDAAVVVMNAKTGEVLAMDGSTDYNSNNPTVAGQNNVAVLPRQPGSTFKPIVYSTAFEQGWYPGMTLTDVKTYFPVPGYNIKPPTDYGGTYGGGDPTIRSALATSRNIPAIKALMFAGVDNVANMARRLGITALDTGVASYNAANHTNLTVGQRFGVSMALGTAEIPLIQMVGAYQVFANNGVRIPPQGILDVWDNYGNHLYHYTPPQGIRVLSPQVSFMMTSILADEPSRRPEFLNDHVLSFADQDPTCAVERVCAHPVAAKTGTTDDFKDNLTIGYTPDVVVGVWAGNADDEPFKGNVVGITGAAPIWHSVMERAVGYCPVDQDGTRGIACGNFNLGFTPQPFPSAPPGIHLASVSSATGLQGTGTQDWIFDGQDPMQPGVTGNPNKQPDNGGATPTPTPDQ